MRKILAVIARDPPFRRRVAFTMRRLTRVAKPPLVKRIPARITQHHPSIRRRVVFPSVSPFPRRRLLRRRRRRRHHTVSLSNKNKKESRFDSISFHARFDHSINIRTVVPHDPHARAAAAAVSSTTRPRPRVVVGISFVRQSRPRRRVRSSPVSQRRSERKKCVDSFLGRLGNAD